MAASCLYDAYPVILAIQFSIIRSHSPKWYHTDSKFHTKARITASQGRLIQHLDMICLPHKVELVASPEMKPNTSACKFGPDVDETKTQHLMIFCRLHSSREALSKYLNKTDLLKGRMSR